MKKSTAILIIIIYVASIILVGFFGMSVKVYDEIKYVKKIEISIEAESESLYTLTKFDEVDSVTGNPQYNLTIRYSSYGNKSVDEDDNQFVLLNIIPEITYDTGDLAGDAESIVYTLNNTGTKHVEKGNISLNEYGTLVCYKSSIAFQIYVNPAAKGGNGTGAIINVYVI